MEKSEIIAIAEKLKVRGLISNVKIIDNTIYQYLIILSITGNRINVDDINIITDSFKHIHTTSYTIDVIQGCLSILFHIR